MAPSGHPADAGSGPYAAVPFSTGRRCPDRALVRGLISGDVEGRADRCAAAGYRGTNCRRCRLRFPYPNKVRQLIITNFPLSSLSNKEK